MSRAGSAALACGLAALLSLIIIALFGIISISGKDQPQGPWVRINGTIFAAIVLGAGAILYVILCPSKFQGTIDGTSIDFELSYGYSFFLYVTAACLLLIAAVIFYIDHRETSLWRQRIEERQAERRQELNRERTQTDYVNM